VEKEMTPMRRGLVWLAAAALAAGALAACSGGDDTWSGTELTVWAERVQMPAVQAAADRYETATGNRVNVIEVNGDSLRTDFLNQAGQGGGPDLVAGQHNWLGEFLAADAIAPLDLGAAAQTFAPITTAAFTSGGQTYAVPYAFANVALIRNADLAPEAPATWADAVAAGEAMESHYPVLVQTGDAGDPYTYYALQASFGAPIFEAGPDGAYGDGLGMGGAGGEAFAAWLAEEGAAGRLDCNITYDIAVSQFTQGKSPFIIGGPWMVDEIKAAGIANLAIDPIPAPGPEAATPLVEVRGFYLAKHSAHAEAAQDFAVRYLGAADTQQALHEASGRYPANVTAAQAAGAADPLAAGFAAVGMDGALVPSTPAMTEVYNYWGGAEARIIKGAEPPAAAWQKMIQDIQAAIG
jgi:arabinogalactan oligomer/maltooligosaccharide transport system substrate-binding protein